jgi:lysophospholipase L1-like esterase
VAAIGRSEPRASYLEPDLSFIERVIRMMHDRNLNQNVADEEVAGYYEGLLAGRPTALLGNARESDVYRFRGDFLYYEPRPDLDVADYDDPVLRHVTNAHGLADREYPLEPTPGTRRIAVLGDSVTRGQGAPFGTGFEALLEDRLNAREPETAYELLNFSVTGYRLTQMVDVALEVAPRFSPDVYLVCLTRLSVSRKWGDHVAQLVYDGIDLKYPALRDLAAEAGIDPRDPPGTMDAKLAAVRLPALRWALSTMRDEAASRDAEMVVLLVPTASSPAALRDVFEGVPELLRELEIPTIDLLDTFGSEEDMTPFMVEFGNIHPNEAGHRQIFEALTRELEVRGGAAVDVLLGP